VTIQIELWGLESNFLGFLGAHTSGVTWTNQTGGTACLHPSIEGIFIPLPVFWLSDYDPTLNCASLTEQMVQEFLDASPELASRFEPIPKFPTSEASGEAWIPVRVKALQGHDMYRELLLPFVGKTGILTYPNSD
jgi:hypothetical protein